MAERSVTFYWLNPRAIERDVLNLSHTVLVDALMIDADSGDMSYIKDFTTMEITDEERKRK